jgi:crotonobetainyl-CoA:carnitine CoA-transferase CaiB-like acyl-CoA transferase
MQAAMKQEIDERLRQWVSQRTAEECLGELARSEVTASRIFSVADILRDKVYQELGDVITVADRDLGDLRMQGVIPRLHNHPGSVWRTGPGLGQDNYYVLSKVLGYSDDDYERLVAAGTIADTRDVFEAGTR